jgi:prepilin-type N-terminal cleavage/methylation domain-containing protein
LVQSKLVKSKQAGFTLIEAMIAIAISLSIILALGKAFKAWGDFQTARAQGAKVAQYNSAVSSFVSNEPARLANLVPPQVFAGFGNYVGIGWLQAPPCPGATGVVNYLPCGFDPFSAVGLTFNTTIAPNGPLILATTNLGPAVTGIGVDRSMGGAIIRAAETYAGSYSDNVQRTYGFMQYGIDIATGNLAAFVGTAILGEPYLRIDGTNQMTGNLNAGGRDVLNARDMNANRNLTANAAAVGGNVAIQNTANAAGNPLNLSESMQSPRLLHDGDLLPMPACTPDKPVPQVFAAPGMFTTVDLTDPIIGVVPLFTPAGAQWQVSLTVATTKFPGGKPGNLNAAVLAGTLCTTN